MQEGCKKVLSWYKKMEQLHNYFELEKWYEVKNCFWLAKFCALTKVIAFGPVKSEWPVYCLLLKVNSLTTSLSCSPPFTKTILTSEDILFKHK